MPDPINGPHGMLAQQDAMLADAAIAQRDLAAALAACREREAIATAAFLHFWRNGVQCPCGARPESPDTHPHNGGCPVGAALARLDTEDRADG